MIAKIIPHIISEFARRTNTELPRGGKLNRIRQICLEIDRLHPQIDYQHRPDNCEYPWPGMDDGTPIIKIPVKFHFPVLDRLASQEGILILKVAEFALTQLLEE